MSFDKPTRNLLAKIVTRCRDRLASDITEQLQSTHGLHPDGTILDVARTEDDRRQMAEAEQRKAEAEDRLRSTDLALQAERLARMAAEQSAIIAGAVEAQTQVAARLAYAAGAQGGTR